MISEIHFRKMDNEANHNISVLSGNNPTRGSSSTPYSKYKEWYSDLFIVSITLNFSG